MADTKTKIIFNRGNRIYTYINPVTKKVEKLAPGRTIELPIDVADKLLIYNKDIADTASKPLPGRTPEETEVLLKNAQNKINDLTVKLEAALKALPDEDSKSKKKNS